MTAVLLACVSLSAAPPAATLAFPLPPCAVAMFGAAELRHADDLRDIAWSGDSRLVGGVARDGGEVRVWDARTGVLRHSFAATGVYRLAFAPQGHLVATAEARGLCLRDYRTGRLETCLYEGDDSPSFVTFSRDGRSLYSGLRGRPHQYDLSTYRLARSWDYVPDESDRAAVAAGRHLHAEVVAVAPDGGSAVWLVSRNGDGKGVASLPDRVVLCDAASGRHLADLDEGKALAAYSPATDSDASATSSTPPSRRPASANAGPSRRSKA